MATASPTKEQTPASDAKASDAKSDTKASDAKATEKSLFTPREEGLLKTAWFCLKSGPPEIDYEKFMKLGEFQTLKTTQNTWGKIKQKLNSMAPPAAEGEEGATTPKTPKAKATPKKRASKKDGDDEEAEDGSPKKKAKATPKKKAAKAEETGETEDVKMEAGNE